MLVAALCATICAQPRYLTACLSTPVDHDLRMADIDRSEAGGARTLASADEEIAHLRESLAGRERELAEMRELRASEQRLRLLLEYSQRLFFIVHFDLSRVYYVSSGFEVIWGRSRESLYQASDGVVRGHPSR